LLVEKANGDEIYARQWANDLLRYYARQKSVESERTE
jgi:hypothetical protein